MNGCALCAHALSLAARAGLITKLPEIDIHCNVSGWAGELRGTKDRRRGKWEGEIVLSEDMHGHRREGNFREPFGVFSSLAIKWPPAFCALATLMMHNAHAWGKGTSARPSEGGRYF